MIFILPIVFSMMSTGALAFSSHNNSNKNSVPTTATTTTTLTKQAHTTAQAPPQPSQSLLLSRRGQSNTKSKSTSALSFSPTDIGGAATLLSLKMDGAKAIANPTQVLTDASYVVMDPHKFFPDIKISKLRMQYAQVFGRLMVMGTTFLPHHGVHPEEMAVQLFLLSVSMKPILRSMKLYHCITSAAAATTTKEGSTCAKECALELEEEVRSVSS